MNFVSENKLSKKARKELNNSRRGSWNGVNPVTRVVPNKGKNAYDRNRSKRETRTYVW